MAEIILPPEENEETPQVPELNIEKPSENSKIITIEFEAKKTNKVSTKDTNQQLYTTDTDAWFEFKETSLEGANGTYSVVSRNLHDGSIFQRTGDVVDGVAYYKIPHQEIRHAGAWRGQVVYTLSNGDTTAREFDYDVKGHILDGKDVREIVVEDFNTLMSQLRSMKENAESELANLTQELRATTDTAEQNETDRQVFFDDLVEDIDELQVNYQELLDTGVLQTNINTKLEALEEEYAPKLTEVTAQLANTSRDIRNIKTNNSIHSSRKLKPVMSIVEDDGHLSVLQKYLPSVLEKKYPVTVAIVTDNPATKPQNYMSENQLKELSDTGYFEFVSHSKKHISSENHTLESWEEEMKESKEWLEERGYNGNVFVYPGGYAPADFRRVASKYYNTAINIDNSLSRINKPPLNSMNLERVYIDYGVENAKGKIDEIVENGGWMILGTHSHYPDFDIRDVEAIVDYARLKGVAIENIENALTYYGNLIEAGDPANYVHDGTVLDATGKWHGYQENFVRLSKRPLGTDTSGTFPPYAVSVYNYPTGWPSRSGMPSDEVGVLMTDRTGVGVVGTKIIQKYIEHGNNRSYYREWDTSISSWSDWKTHLTIERLEPESIDINSSYVLFPEGTISYMRYRYGAENIPDVKGGLLMTNTIENNASFTFQEFRVASSNNNYYRYWDTTTTNWSDWVMK